MLQYCQVRPDPRELIVLRRMRIISGNSGSSGTIVMNWQYPRSRVFYSGKKDSVAAIWRLNVTSSEPVLDSMGSTGITSSEKVQSQQALTLCDQTARASSHMVNSTLAPRLQVRHLVDMPSAPWFTSANTEGPQNLPANVSTSSSNEARLQELEIEVLKLRMDFVVKDREIRKLKADNEMLRGDTHATGRKRPCL